MTFTTDYLYRGISQTSEQPAIQGSVDYSHEPSGLYLGGWGSNVDFAASSEFDIYGGIAGELANGMRWDVGGVYYIYPGSSAQPEENFVEVYFNTGYTFAYPYQPTLAAGLAYSPDFFGEDGAAVYVYGSVDFSLPHDFGLSFHVGYQDVAGDQTTGPAGFNYSHYSIGLGRQFGQWEVSASWNDAEDDCGGGGICQAVVASISVGF